MRLFEAVLNSHFHNLSWFVRIETDAPQIPGLILNQRLTIIVSTP